MGKVVVIGIDGATWDLLDVLMDRGVMPCLNEIVKDSAKGHLQSTYPPVTAPAWVSIATGVNPGKHGCFDFNRAEGSLSKIRPLQSWDIQSKTFYEILSEKSKGTILLNLPGTYPPLTSNITITSLLTQGDNCVFPENLKDESDIFKNYRIFPDTSLLKKGDLQGYIKDIKQIEKLRFEAMKHLFQKDWDCFFVVFSGGDWLSHEIFAEMVEGKAPKESYEVFRLFDDAIRFVAKSLKDDDTLLMVSDHGFKRAKGVLHINELLLKKGFLEPDFLNPSPPMSHKMEEKLFDQGDYKKVSPNFLRLGLNNVFVEKIIRAIRKLGFSYPLFLKPETSRSLAMMMTSESYGITINDKNRFADGKIEKAEISEIKEKLKSFLLEIEFNGEKVFKDAFYKEDVYSGEYVESAPDIIFGDSNWGYSSAIRTLEKNPFAVVPRGVHSHFGVFLCYGRNIVPKTIGKGVISVEDITPMILYLLEEKIPKNLDGKVIKEIIEKKFLEKHPVEYCDFEKPTRERKEYDGDEIQKKLKSLGYMS